MSIPKVPKTTRRSIALLICALGLSGVIIAANEINLRGTRDSTLNTIEANLTSQSIVLAEEVDRSLKALDLALSIVADRTAALGIEDIDGLRRGFTGWEAHQWLRERVSGMPHVQALALIDQAGISINTSRLWPGPVVDVSDREYFRMMKADPNLQTLVSQPVHSRAADVWSIYLIRRLNAPNGDFLGLALGAISLDHFETYFRSISLQEGSSVALVRNDGQLVVHSAPDRELPPLAAPAAAPGQARAVAISRTASASDDSRIFAATRPLAHYPLSIVVIQDEHLALRDWRSLARFSNILAGGTSLLLLLLAGAAFVWWYKQEALNDELAQQNVRFDTLIDNMSAGLCMFDSDRRLVVCNDRYVQLYKLPPELSQPGTLHADIIAYRIRNGLLRGEPTEHTIDNTHTQLAGMPATSAFTRIDELADGRLICVTRQPMTGGGWVAIHEDISILRKSEEKILHMARHDALTDLPNRALLRERLEHVLKATSRNGRSVAMFMLDLDRFKDVNDTLGHLIGDDLLKAVAKRLRACARETATIARLGGDEFAIVEEVLDPLIESTALAERIRKTLLDPFDIHDHQVLIGCSIGVAIGPQDGTNPDELLKNADLALYRAKAEGRGTHCFFEPEMDRRIQARREMERDLRTAIAENQFELFYQPIINLETNEIASCEALLRWWHPTRGCVSPAEFIGLAEETGLIQRIGEWVIRTACRTAANWPRPVAVAVNVSAAQVRGGGLTPLIMSALADSGLSADRLEVEITESVMMEESEATFSTLRQLHAMGVRISLDDFGTGCSSLSHLRKFSFDKIKIDRSFVAELADSAGTSRAIVHSLIQLAKMLGKKTTAEGVETQEVCGLVREIGCSELQGYFFSKPVRVAEIEKMLRLCGASERTATAA